MRLLVLVVLFVPVIAFADAYKCVVDGKTIYSQQPCDDKAHPIESKVSGADFLPTSGDESESVVLAMASDGHYYVNGSLDGLPVRFLVDTGASNMMVSQRIADRLAPRGCVGRTNMSTANGVVHNACVVNVQNMTVAGHHVTGVSVIVAPDYAGDALLGMDVMRFWRLTQRSGNLLIEF